MKKVKLTMMILIMCLMSIVVLGQSRTNVDKIEFSNKTEKLTKAEGWEQNKTTGEWVSNKNVISSTKSQFVSMIAQNFRWLQFSKIEKNGVNYYVLLFEKESGSYKYPNIKRDWEREIQTHFFIITESEFNELKDKLKLNNGETIQLKSKMNGSITDRYKILGGENLYNDENLLNKIRNTIDKPNYFEHCFTLNSQIVDGSNLVRFRLAESCNLSSDIKTKYFEVLNNEFQKILF